jgi:hypothetical protein
VFLATTLPPQQTPLWNSLPKAALIVSGVATLLSVRQHVNNFFVAQSLFFELFNTRQLDATVSESCNFAGGKAHGFHAFDEISTNPRNPKLRNVVCRKTRFVIRQRRFNFDATCADNVMKTRYNVFLTSKGYTRYHFKLLCIPYQFKKATLLEHDHLRFHLAFAPPSSLCRRRFFAILQIHS